MSMRLVGLALVVAAGSLPAAAEACETSSCRRWAWLELTRDSFPRDAAITLRTPPIRQVCTEDLRAFATVVVHRGDELVPGAFELPVGLYNSLVWYPEQPLAPGAYTLHVEVDNAALDEFLEVPASPLGPCQPDEFIQDIAFTVVDEASPPAPSVVPPPTFGQETRRLDTGWRSLACCEGSEPQRAIGGDCLPTTAGVDCTYLYDYTHLIVASEPFAYEAGHAGLWLYQLVVDGEVVARGTSPLEVRRSQRACAHLEAIHFGTGEVVASEVVCPPDELAVGPTAHAPQDEPSCALLACGTDDGWDVDRCQAYDGVHPPFEPAAPLADDVLVTPCEVPAPATMPVYPQLPDIQERGCGCSSAPTAGPWMLVLAGLRRRRRR